MWSRVQIAALTALLAASHLPNRAEAEPGPSAPPSTVLFQNVRIFDGKSAALSAPSNVLVRGNTIEKISTEPIPLDNANVTTIDGRGRTLMPGLIDAHWHAMLARPNPGRGSVERHRLSQSAGRRRSDGDIAARLHHHPRHGRTGLRPEARDRRRAAAGTAHLSVRRGHHHHRRSWRFSRVVGAAADARNAVPRRADGRSRRRRQSG